MYKRFISTRADMHHDRLQPFVVIDYSREMVILAVLREEEKETIVGMAQYLIDEKTHTAEVAFVVRDELQGRGIGATLLSYVTYLARKSGLLGFTAAVLMENRQMLQLFEKAGFIIEKRAEGDIYELKMSFRE
jgi:RimJ/RimL family protein N-acetyltransferase